MKKFLKVSLLHIATLILITLQLAGVINVSWWVVFGPSIIGLFMAIAVIIFMAVLIKSGKMSMDKFMTVNEDASNERFRKSIQVIRENEEDDDK